MKLFFFALGVLLSLSLSAQAQNNTIFMINLNYSKQEMEATKKVAAARGMHFVMVPPEHLVTQAEKNGALWENIKREAKKYKGGWSEAQFESALYGLQQYFNIPADDRAHYKDKIADPTTKKIADALGKQFENYMAEKNKLIKLESSLPTVYEQIRQMGQKFRAEGKRSDAVVISGHSSGAVLAGESSVSITEQQLRHAKSEFQEILSPRHLLLMGCYTTTEVARASWRDAFPKVSMIAGFDARAPLRTRPASSAFIAETLATADRLDRQQLKSGVLAPQTVNNAFKALESFKLTHAALEYCHVHVTKNTKNISCDDQWGQFIAWAQQVTNDYFAFPPLKDPPEQTDGTVLRGFYNQLQQICDIRNATGIPEAERAEWTKYRDIYRDMAIRLIFWRNVQKNFGVHHANDFKRLQETLDEAGLNLKVPKLDGNQGRVAFGKFYTDMVNGLNAHLNKKSEEVYKETDPVKQKEKLDALTNYQQKIVSRIQFIDGLVTLDPANVPFAWVEPGVVHSPRPE